MENPRREIFNHLAENWDASTHLSQDQIRTIQDVVKLSGISPNAAVLDVGCGTGIMTEYILCYLGEKGHLAGIDVSDEMIRIAKGKHNDRRVSFINGDIYHHSFDENSYDVIFAFSCFPHFHDKEYAFDIFHKILNDTGKLVIFHLDSSAHMNTFHKTKVKNEILKADHLPSGSEIMKMIDDGKWKPVKIEDREKLYLVYLEKK